ncbi:hypothetical protein KIN20_023626, partial [Parelaphostrongylus tenuis]
MSTSSDSAVKKLVDTHHSNPTPEPPIVRNSPEEPDSLWLPMGQKADSSPEASFSSAPSSSLRHVHATTSARNNIPFNGPVYSDRLTSKLISKAATSPSPLESLKNDFNNHNEVLLEEFIPRQPLEPEEYSGIVSGEIKGTHRSEWSSRSKIERQESSSSHCKSESRSPHGYSDTNQGGSPVTRESRKRASSRSSSYDRNVSDSSIITVPRRFELLSSPLPWHRKESRDHSSSRRQT